jgi:ABC-type multidrug transport system fused ATPase/permease subunit
MLATRADASDAAVPEGIYGYNRQTGAAHQATLCLIAIAVFLIGMAPLELQRRIVNGAFEKRDLSTILTLCATYIGVAVVAGGLKLGLHVYRGWVSERSVRHLRGLVYDLAVRTHQARRDDPRQEGIGLSVILAEAEAVGGFVGISISEPLLELGILVSVFGYMLVIQPWMALLSLALFSPQLVFVPLLQRRINKRARKRIEILRDVSADLVDDWGHDGIGRHRGVFERRIHRIFGLNMRIYKLKFAMTFIMNLLHHLGIAGVLLVGGWFIVEGRIEVGTVVAFISGLSRVNEPWTDLVAYFREMTVAQVKYRLIASVLSGSVPRAADMDAVAESLPAA